MPLQKRKKKKPATDKSVKQVVTQVVKVNIGDTKPKKKRKRKASGAVSRAVAPSPMLAQVPQQQFIYPPQSFPQEQPMAPPRQSAPSIEVPNPVPVSALNRVLGSIPRSTLAVPQEVPRSTLIRPAQKPELVMPAQPVMIPKPELKPSPMKMSRNVEVVDEPKPFVPKPKLTGVNILPIDAPDIPESVSVAKLMRAKQKPTIVDTPKVVLAPDKEVSGVFASAKADPLYQPQQMQPRLRRVVTDKQGKKSLRLLDDPMLKEAKSQNPKF